MEILEAYCEELVRVVDIYEAQEEYFALPPLEESALIFIAQIRSVVQSLIH